MSLNIITNPNQLPATWTGRMRGQCSITQEQAQALADKLTCDAYYLVPTKTMFILAEKAVENDPLPN